MSDNTTQFQVGDVVRLKSGGPDMTVKRLMGVGADCVWFQGGNRLSECAWFESDLLMRVENPGASE
jgi:uncharacterized protein YodC (DUF2158 family)